MFHRSFGAPQTAGWAYGAWRTIAALGAMLAVLVLSGRAQAQTFTTLHAFAGHPDGASPAAPLSQSFDGNLYGTTQTGGDNDLGTIYRIASGTFTIVHSFAGPEGADPFGEVVQGFDGNFYGTTALGGTDVFNGHGVVYRLTSSGVVSALHVFTGGSDGDHPETGLLAWYDGNLYGTTTTGGDTDNGTVFRISTTGTFTTLHSFNGTDGSFPLGTLIVGPDGNFYGTTINGGTANGGTVYRISPSGAFASLHSFTFASGDGNSPRGSLVVGADGNFYGTTEFGGVNGTGVTFRMTPTGTTTILHSFAGSEGANPLAGMVRATDGNFYGTTSSDGNGGAGTIFAMTPGGALTVVHSFANPEGTFPVARLLQGRDGALYGTTLGGGPASAGTVFRQTLAAAPGPGPATFTPRVATNQPYYTEEDVILSTPAGITALTLTITVRITPGLRFSGMYQTVFGQITQSSSTGPATITYTFVLQNGNTIPPGTFTFAAQMGSSGVRHDPSGDTFDVTYTSGGQTFTQSGHF